MLGKPLKTTVIKIAKTKRNYISKTDHKQIKLVFPPSEFAIIRPHDRPESHFSHILIPSEEDTKSINCVTIQDSQNI